MPTGRPGRVFWRIRAGVFEGLEGSRRPCRPGRIRVCVGIIIMIFCSGGFAAGADVSRPTPRLNTARKEEKGLFIVGFRAMSGPSLLSSTPNQSKSMLLAATRGPVLQFPHFIGVIRTPITEVALPIPKVPKRAEAKGRGGVRSVQE